MDRRLLIGSMRRRRVWPVNFLIFAANPIFQGSFASSGGCAACHPPPPPGGPSLQGSDKDGVPRGEPSAPSATRLFSLRGPPEAAI